jgi:hypothetical protein
MTDFFCPNCKQLVVSIIPEWNTMIYEGRPKCDECVKTIGKFRHHLLKEYDWD